MPETDRDGWREWSKFVLKELERLNENYEKLNEKMQQASLHEAQTCPYKDDIKDLKQKDREHDVLIRKLELKFAKWTGIAIAALSVINVAVHYILNRFGG